MSTELQLRCEPPLLGAGCAAKKVAQEVGFDKKTVTKHIPQVEELTGLHLDRVDHVRTLGLALQLRKVVRSDPIAG